MLIFRLIFYNDEIKIFVPLEDKKALLTIKLKLQYIIISKQSYVSCRLNSACRLDLFAVHDFKYFFIVVINDFRNGFVFSTWQRLIGVQPWPVNDSYLRIWTRLNKLSEGELHDRAMLVVFKFAAISSEMFAKIYFPFAQQHLLAVINDENFHHELKCKVM